METIKKLEDKGFTFIYEDNVFICMARKDKELEDYFHYHLINKSTGEKVWDYPNSFSLKDIERMITIKNVLLSEGDGD